MRNHHHQFQHRINGIRRFHRGEQSVLVVITGIYAGANFKGYHFRALQAGAGMRQGEKGTAAERFITAMERTAMDKPRTKPRPSATQTPAKDVTKEAPRSPAPAEAQGTTQDQDRAGKAVSGPTAPGNEAATGPEAAEPEQAPMPAETIGQI
jgi:hypothetical protein